MILPQLDELPLPEATRDWPHTDEAAAISLVRCLVLLKCCGRENSERAFYDPLLRDLLLIPPTLSPRSVAHLAGATQAGTFAKFSRRSMRMASGPAVRSKVKQQLLSRRPARRARRRLLVLIDAARGLWLWIDTYHRARRPQKLIQSLRSSLTMLVEEAGLLYSDPSLVCVVAGEFPAIECH